MRICGKCHKHIVNIQVLTPAGEAVCPHCGYRGEVDFNNVWLCEECGEVTTDHIGEKRPNCPDCTAVMSLVQAIDDSPVRGCGTGDRDLELGLALLMEAQV